MPHVDDSIREVVHALDHLRLDGVMLSTSYDGEYLASDRLAPLLAELNERSALAFIHPVTPMGMDLLRLDFPASLLEYAFDTTRCIASLLRHSIPSRYPNIRFIFSHAGGTLPFLLHRMSLMEYFVTAGHNLSVEADRERIRLGLQHFYYDVALSAHDAVFALLRDTIGFDRVLFGSDYPQVPESFVMAAATTLTIPA